VVGGLGISRAILTHRGDDRPARPAALACATVLDGFD
jgi:hypothetical protein